MLGLIKRASQSVCNINRCGYLQRNGPIGSIGPNIHQRRLYMPFKCPSEARSSSLWRATRESFNKLSSFRNFSVTSGINAAARRSQIVSKRLFGKHGSSCDGAFTPIINTRAAVTMTLVGTFIIVPGIFALTFAAHALFQKDSADCIEKILKLACTVVAVGVVAVVAVPVVCIGAFLGLACVIGLASMIAMLLLLCASNR